MQSRVSFDTITYVNLVNVNAINTSTNQKPLGPVQFNPQMNIGDKSLTIMSYMLFHCALCDPLPLLIAASSG